MKNTRNNFKTWLGCGLVLFIILGCLLEAILPTSETEKSCRKNCYENPYYDQFSGLLEGEKRNECLKRCH